MGYFLNLFSPETYEAFKASSREVSGFRLRQKIAAERIHPGDKLLCYMTKLSRWFGLFEVVSGPYQDDSPIFHQESDPYVIRFKVRSLILLEPDKSIPIHEDDVWNTLSFTQGHQKTSSTWTGKIRSSLVQMDDSDGELLERLLYTQNANGRIFPVDSQEYAKWTTHAVRRTDKVISVSVPSDSADGAESPSAAYEVRESIKVQALIADIGRQMGLRIWIPRNDKAAVLRELPRIEEAILSTLPLNYDDTTLKTIEQIDVLWLKGRSIVRAFEVEHTTSIYSGILRMADLLALRPNMDIKLHIVAPSSKRDKVFQEIRRPVFSLLERGPLSESCTYLSFESLKELSEQKHLSHLSDTVLDEYAEDAE